MKKEIINLLNCENGILKVNKFALLKRSTKNFFGERVDILKFEASINSVCDYSIDIKSRDFKGIVEEVEIAMIEAFKQASEKCASEIRSGRAFKD